MVLAVGVVGAFELFFAKSLEGGLEVFLELLGELVVAAGAVLVEGLVGLLGEAKGGVEAVVVDRAALGEEEEGVG